MGRLILKRNDQPPASQKIQPHIMIVGMPEWQSLISDFVELMFGNGKPIVETPTYADTERYLGQLEPNLVIVANYKMGLGLTLDKITAKVPPTSIVVMCDEFTLAKVIPTGVHVTTSKDIKKLLPVLKNILQAQGY